MPFRTNRISKKKADPQILSAYKDLRNERRSEWLYQYGLLGVALICVVDIMLMVFFQPGPIVVLVGSCIGICLLMGFFALLAGWGPRNSRRWMWIAVIGFFLLAAGVSFLEGFFEQLIFS